MSFTAAIQRSFPTFTRNPKAFFLFLTLIIGILALWPLHDFQYYLAQGDHGRDLYGFQATMNGALPYRDYWWVYGPLMPYYYSLFFKVLGISIKSVLLGKLILNLLSGIFLFLTLSLFIPHLFAFMAALWFWIFQPDFFFTYNHASGITMLMASTFCLFEYLQTTRIRYLYGILLSLFIFSLIKINFGLVFLMTFLIILYAADRINKIPFSPPKRLFYAAAVTLFPLLLFLIYFSLLRDLPLYTIRQCFPYLGSDHPYNASLGTTLSIWWQAIAFNINENWVNRFFGLFIIISISLTFHELFHNKIEKRLRQRIIFAISILAILYTVNLHEFLVSGVFYRTFWAKPFSILLSFLFIGFAIRNHPKTIRALLILTLALIIFLKYTDRVKTITTKKNQGQYLSLKKGQVIIANSIRWLHTVEQVTHHLKTRLEDDETFLAMPYDPLYYFLSDKISPTRQLIFFEHINIPEEQERKIIDELEKKRVNYVLLSSRMSSGETGLGTFGKDYCPLIAEYLDKNFKVAAVFGDWKNPAGWAWNHGVRILKRVGGPDEI